MPTPATLPHYYQVPSAMVWKQSYGGNDFFINCSNDPYIFEAQYDFHSIDKQFVQIESAFKNQFDKLANYYDGIDINFAKQKLALSLSLILELCPDVLTVELTPEKSIFYTLKKDDFTFFFQHFIEVNEDDDEAILTGFKGKSKLPSYAGS